jgi:hypothetical protein
MKRVVASLIAVTLIVISPKEMLSQGQVTSAVVVTSVVPATIATASTTLDMIVRGSGFTSKSQVRVKGARRTTTFVSPGELRSRLVEADVAAPGSSAITVFTPGLGSSNAIALVIEGAAAALPVDTEPPRFTTQPQDLTLPATRPEGADVALILPLATDNSGAVTVTSVPQANVGITFPVGTTTVIYTAADPSGNKATVTSTVTVTPLPPPPTMSISGLEPSSAIPGAQSFTLGVRGAGFTNGMIIRWNGGDRRTSFLVSSLLQADIGASSLVSPGTTSVTVFDPATGSETPVKIFYIDAAMSGIPRITALGKTTGVAGTIIEFAINGDGFVAGSVVRLNGVDVPANKVSLNGSRIIGVQFPVEMTAAPGTYRVTVFNPGPNGGESNAALFTVTPP